MEEPLSTPKLPPSVSALKNGVPVTSKEQLFSSSPGFGTPAFPIASRPARTVAQSFAQQAAANNNQTVLSILLPSQTLRPVAFRTLTKKHNLTLTSPGLTILAEFVGKFCGSRWREDGLAERVLDEIAKQWKRDNGGIIIDDTADKKLRNLLKSFETCMFGGRLDTGRLSRTNSLTGNLSRQNSDLRPELSRDDSQGSLGVSALEVEDNLDIDEEALSRQDVRSYLKVISAYKQPRLVYSTSKKTLEPVNGSAAAVAPIQHKISMFRNRYHLVHQRLLRNESFQAPSFSTAFAPPKLLHSSSTANLQQAYKITPISNLLGRSGTSHLLLGLLVYTAAGDLALTDLTSSVVLEISTARPVPDDGAWFCPGMIVLTEGTYEEDGSHNSSLGSAGGVGGQIKGHFIVDTIAGPPAERREVTLGTTHDLKADKIQISGAGFGWIDFLGVGSEKAVGTRMRNIQKRLLHDSTDPDDEPVRNKMIIIGECHLDSPRTLEAIRAILSSYLSTQNPADQPLSVVFMGNFVSVASMAGSTKGAGSIEYKEYFDNLASMLAEFPALLASTTFVFIPGDNDPWASSFSAGGAALLPKQGIPDIFTSRVRRAIANANSEAGKKEGDSQGEAIWTSNPARLSLFGPVDEIVMLRDDITGRLRRNAVTFAQSQENDGQTMDVSQPTLAENGIEEANHDPEADIAVRVATSHLPRVSEKLTSTPSMKMARKLVKTVLDQGHLSPFPTSTRPVFWDYASSLILYPLPTAFVLADSEAPAFAITYEGCHVMNPGRVLDELGMRKGVAKWMEYDVRMKKGYVRDIRF